MAPARGSSAYNRAIVGGDHSDNSVAGTVDDRRRLRVGPAWAGGGERRREARPQAPGLTRTRRWRALGQRGATVWFTGLPGAGKSTIAAGVEERLVLAGRSAFLLDGDNLRRGLNRDLGFEPSARRENVRRTAYVASLLAESGSIALVSLVSPYAADRRAAAALHRAGDLPFVEVFVDAPLALCERRDPKGLYARARAGELADLTGVGAPYEPPRDPDLVIGQGGKTAGGDVEQVLVLLAARGLIASRRTQAYAPGAISSS
jgi:bifunctional enzyme CysN/CysC